MGERIPVPGVHKKCGKRKLFRSVGGDVMLWCDYCNSRIVNYNKEVSAGIFSWLPLLYYWLKKFLKNKN